MQTKWSERDEAARISEHKLWDVLRMEAVHVLARIERAHDSGLVDVLRWRRLHQNAMNARIAIELFNARKQLRLCGRSRKLQFHRVQSQLAAHLVFRTYIGARSRIVSNENDGKARRNAFFLQFRNLASKIDIHFLRDCASIDQFRHSDAGN